MIHFFINPSKNDDKYLIVPYAFASNKQDV